MENSTISVNTAHLIKNRLKINFQQKYLLDIPGGSNFINNTSGMDRNRQNK